MGPHGEGRDVGEGMCRARTSRVLLHVAVSRPEPGIRHYVGSPATSKTRRRAGPFFATDMLRRVGSGGPIVGTEVTGNRTETRSTNEGHVRPCV